MIKVFLTCGIPGSGKSTWAKQEVSKDPDNYLRISNDDIRAMANGSSYSPEYEKMIGNIRNFLIKEGIKNNKNIIVDNLNLNSRHWDSICKMAKESNKDIQVMEKHFYVELDEAISRDSKREGKAKVGEEVIKKWWKESGKASFKYYKPRVEIFRKNYNISDNWVPMEQDRSKTKAVIFDNDGTISLLNGRNPYDASTCDEDMPHTHVIECMKLYYNAGYKILFVSGREEKDREPTERFYQKHFPEVKYELYMRPTGDMRKDVLIKEEIFNNYIKDKYFIAGWFDDRLQVSKWVYNSGLPLFRVNNPEATF